MSRNIANLQIGAYEAVARALVRTLTVPQIFFEAPWPEADTHVDVLAIDRAGSGDLHVVEVKTRIDQVTASTIRRLLRVPAHYRWIACSVIGGNKQSIHDLSAKLTKSGIGLIEVVTMANGELGVNVILKPNRAESFDRAKIGDFLRGRVPDIEYGESPRASTKVASLAPLSKEKIECHLNEADSLYQQGHHRAAFLLAWSVTEAAIKLSLDAGGQEPLRPPGVMMRELGDVGVLTAAELDSLRNAFTVRNLLVHGVNGPRDLGETYRIVTALARKLIDNHVGAAPIQ
jgi:uncharacterized protein YutE (UPF0331/DUF86 family)